MEAKPSPSTQPDFTFPPELSPFNVSPQEFITAHPEYKLLATGGLIFTTSSNQAKPKILLLQRAATDSMPFYWEVPGGAVDLDDPTILHGLVREVYEETKLKVKRVAALVGDMKEHFGGRQFFSRSGKCIVKFEFVVEVEEGGEVKLDPWEHMRFEWMDEEECKTGKGGVGEGEKDEDWNGDKEFQFTTKEQKEVVLMGFELKKGEFQR